METPEILTVFKQVLFYTFLPWVIMFLAFLVCVALNVSIDVGGFVIIFTGLFVSCVLVIRVIKNWNNHS